MAKIAASLPLFPILDQSPDPPVLTGIARMAAEATVIDQGHEIDFRPLPVRSILNHVNSRRGFSFARSINPYRGCEFGCRYCYARYTHEFMELRDPYAFERQVYMKENAAWLLQQELKTLRPEEDIAIGTATDPYQPIERDAKITRSLLEVLSTQRGLRIGLVTKSTLVLRDIDLLQRIREHNSITLNVTITTLDTKLARILEPRAPRPDLRLKAIAKLRRAGLRAGVLCCPLLPGLTDTYAAIDSVATGAKQAGASFFHANPLFLKPCSKTVFEEFIAKNFPELLASYRQRFEDRAFVSTAYRKRVMQLVEAIKKKHGWGGNPGERFSRRQELRAAQMEMQYPRPSAPGRAQTLLNEPSRKFPAARA
ncbi:MAG TPA: radical SAM protein [Acidobacteriaceae bacterium]|nr:radical SAM protein [Acidobacteriaceae bacterium]